MQSDQLPLTRVEGRRTTLRTDEDVLASRRVAVGEGDDDRLTCRQIAQRQAFRGEDELTHCRSDRVSSKARVPRR